MRRTVSPLWPLALVAVLAACQDAAVTAPASRSGPPILSPVIATVDETPVSYFAPRTIVRAGTGVQTVQFTLNEHDHSLFMDPFLLNVRAEGDQRIVGIVKVDGVPILERRDLIALGQTQVPLSRVVAVGPSSVVTVELQGPTGGSLTFWMDAPLQPPPVITITSPVRQSNAVDDLTDAFLKVGTQDPSSVDITGTACHVRYPITELEIAGTSVPVPGTNLCEPFTVTQQSPWGLTIITGTARNSRGRVGNVVQGFLRSDDYYEKSAQKSIPGYFTKIGPLAIDDGDRTTANDVATHLENSLTAAIVNVPPSVVISCQGGLFDAWITGGRLFQSMKLNSLTASSTGLAFNVSVYGSYVDVRTRTDLNPFDGCDGDLNVITGQVGASEVRATGTAVFGAGGVGLSVSNLQLQWFGFYVNVDNVPPEFTNPISTIAQGRLGELIGDHLIEPTVEGFLNDWFAEVTLPPPTTILSLNSAQLQTSGAFYDIEPAGAAPNGFVAFGMSSEVKELTQDPTVNVTEGPIKGLCVQQAPCKGGLVKGPPFATTPKVGFSVHQDKLNATFWSAWRGGAFNIPDASTIPGVGSLTAMSMSVQATLPPVSMATDPSGPVPPGDQPPTFEMGWGDVRVHATFDPATVGLPAGAPIEVDAWVSVMTRGELAVNQKAGRLAISNETSEAQIQLLSPILAYSDAAIRAAILADVSAAITSLSRNAVGVIPIKLNVSRLGNTVVETVTKEKMNYVVKGNF